MKTVEQLEKIAKFDASDAFLAARIADIKEERANEAMELLIYMILSEYPTDDERYKTAMDIGTEFGITNVNWLMNQNTQDQITETIQRLTELERVVASNAETECGKREWVGLTDDERMALFEKSAGLNSYAKNIEAKLKDKNT